LFETYRISGEERDGILYWLKSTRIKVVAAKDAGDRLKASYVSTVTSWKILEGIWAANDRPVPPCGAVWAHIKDLSKTPAYIEAWLQRLFVGNADDRIETAVEIMDWIIPLLEEAGEETEALSKGVFADSA
jgi:hypothetical protein